MTINESSMGVRLLPAEAATSSKASARRATTAPVRAMIELIHYHQKLSIIF
jgi:hypothetical protein